MSAMLDALGIGLWPMALSLALVLVLGLSGAWALFRPGASAEPRRKVWIDAILFWGGFALICGALGSVMGLIRTLQGYEAAGEFAPRLLASGLVAFTLNLVVGLSILAIAALFWFVLQLRWRLLAMATSGDADLTSADTPPVVPGQR